MQAGHPHCISVRTVERELLLRCSSDAEAEIWRRAITSNSGGIPGSVESFRGTSSVDVSEMLPKRTTDSLIAEDGDASEPFALAHRYMTDLSLSQSVATSVNGSGGAIPGWDGKKNSLGWVARTCSGGTAPHHARHRFIRIPGTSSMFWDLERSCAIFLPTLWIYPHISCVRFPDYLELGRHKQVASPTPPLLFNAGSSSSSSISIILSSIRTLTRVHVRRCSSHSCATVTPPSCSVILSTSSTAQTRCSSAC